MHPKDSLKRKEIEEKTEKEERDCTVIAWCSLIKRLVFSDHQNFISTTFSGQMRFKNARGESDIIIPERESELQFSNPDVMGQVFYRLNDLVTRVRCSAVCQSWRWVAQRTPQLPWLMFPRYLKSDDCLEFFSLSDGMTHKLHLPEVGLSRCCGTFEGWLIMQNFSNRRLFLIDPLSKAQIRIEGYEQLPEISIAFLSSAPKSNDGANNINCLVVAISSTHLHSCRLGDPSWTRHSLGNLGFECSFNNQISLHHEGLLVVREYSSNTIMVFELDHYLNYRLKHSFNLHGLGGNIVGFIRSYLVEWCGELFLALSDRIETQGLVVYKFDSRWNLVKVEGLGDGTIFVANFLVKDCVKCLSIRDFPALNLKPNCMYYVLHPCNPGFSVKWFTPHVRY